MSLLIQAPTNNLLKAVEPLDAFLHPSRLFQGLRAEGLMTSNPPIPSLTPRGQSRDSSSGLGFRALGFKPGAWVSLGDEKTAHPRLGPLRTRHAGHDGGKVQVGYLSCR